MISVKSLSILIKLFSIGQMCQFVPFKWDLKHEKLVRASSPIHKLFPFLAGLLGTVGLIYTLGNYSIQSRSDFIMVLFFGVAALPAILAVGWISWNQNQIIAVLNGTFHLNKAHCKQKNRT